MIKTSGDLTDMCYASSPKNAWYENHGMYDLDKVLYECLIQIKFSSSIAVTDNLDEICRGFSIHTNGDLFYKIL